MEALIEQAAHNSKILLDYIFICAKYIMVVQFVSTVVIVAAIIFKGR